MELAITSLLFLIISSKILFSTATANCYDVNNNCWYTNMTSCTVPTSNVNITVQGETCISECQVQWTNIGLSCKTNTQYKQYSIYGSCYPDCYYQLQSYDWLYPECYDAANNCFNADLDICIDEYFVYAGNKSTDIYDNACVKWTESPIVLIVGNASDEIFFFDFIGDHNYCRNALTGVAVGCITSNGTINPCFSTCTSTTTAITSTTTKEIRQTTVITNTDASGSQYITSTTSMTSMTALASTLVTSTSNSTFRTSYFTTKTLPSTNSSTKPSSTTSMTQNVTKLTSINQNSELSPITISSVQSESLSAKSDINSATQDSTKTTSINQNSELSTMAISLPLSEPVSTKVYLSSFEPVQPVQLTTSIATTFDELTSSTSIETAFFSSINTTTTIEPVTYSTQILCEYTQWKREDSCTGCGKNSTVASTREVANQYNSPEYCTDLSKLEPCLEPKACNPMSSTLQLVSKMITTFGCTWLLGTTITSFVVLALLRSASYERFLQQGEEITVIISHLFILFLSSDVQHQLACKITAICLQYFYLSSFTFFLIEALQTYYVFTQVISAGGILSKWRTLLICLGVPAIITFSTVIRNTQNLSADFICWINFSHNLALGSVIPILIMIFLTIIITEATFMGSYEVLPMTNKSQMTSASINRNAMVIKFPFHCASWFTMVVAGYYQRFALFPICLGCNITFGWTILLFHLLGSDEARNKMKMVFERMKRICQKSY